jgi:hypothetical protein
MHQHVWHILLLAEAYVNPEHIVLILSFKGLYFDWNVVIEELFLLASDPCYNSFSSMLLEKRKGTL